MDLLEDFKGTRCHWRAISIDHLDQIKDDVESLHDNGKLDEAFYESSLTGFRYKIPDEMPDAQSIVIASVPQPAVTINFSWKGGSTPATVPPTYGKGPEVNAHVQRLLEDAVKPKQYRFIRALLPLKTTAVRSGLAAYGKCNVTFVPGIGSYHRLVAFFTNCPGLEDQWQEREAMTRCSDCVACTRSCPTGAITEDRFLIKADRCLAYLNEMSSDCSFPDWVDRKWHNCIVGCMRCQRGCPENKRMLTWSENQLEFSEEETTYLMRGEFKGEEARWMEEKLQKVGLDLSIFPRNLEALLK